MFNEPEYLFVFFYEAPSAFLHVKNFVLLNYYEQFLDLEIWQILLLRNPYRWNWNGDIGAGKMRVEHFHLNLELIQINLEWFKRGDR